MSNVPTNDQDLREMVYHTDARVTALDGKLNYVVNSSDQLAVEVRGFIAQQSKPKDVNYAAWTGVFLTLIALLIGGTIGFSNYVTLTQAPLKELTEKNTTRVAGLRTFQQQTHYELGVVHEHRKTSDSEIALLREKMDKVVAEQAKAEAERSETRDYLRDVDRLGSRRWVDDEALRASR